MTTLEKKQVSTVVEQDLALKVYIDSLLFEDLLTETETETQVEVQTETKTEVEQKIEQKVEPPPTVVELKPKTVPVERVEVAEPVTEVKVEQQVEPARPEPPKPESPEWVEKDFEALKFQVAGFLSLAVPLVSLNGIVSWSDDITLVPGHAEWFLGLMQSRGRQVKLIDIARFVIPQNHKARQSLENRPKFKHVVLINDGEWGLACDDLADVLKLQSDDIKWRTQVEGVRPWLAGTIVDEMCALLDVEQFVKSLKEGCKVDDITQ